MQQGNFVAAEVVYRKAQIIDPDANKARNLSLCLIKLGRNMEARSILLDVLQGELPGSDDPKARTRAEELLQGLEPLEASSLQPTGSAQRVDDAFIEGLDLLMNQWVPLRSKRLPIFEEISPFRDQLAC